MRPVIVGVGEISNKDPERIAHPVDLMEDAVRRALHAVQQDRVITGRPQVIRIENGSTSTIVNDSKNNSNETV